VTIKAKSTDQVCIEQIGGYKTMAGWMWVSQAEECERLQQRLAAAEAERDDLQRRLRHYEPVAETKSEGPFWSRLDERCD